MLEAAAALKASFRTRGACSKFTKNPATRNRTRDHLIAAALYSQMLYQLSYSRLVSHALSHSCWPSCCVCEKCRWIIIVVWSLCVC